MSEVTKLLVNYVKAGHSLEALEAEMVRDVKADLQKMYPVVARQNPDELTRLATDLVRTHLGKRIAEKVGDVK